MDAPSSGDVRMTRPSSGDEAASSCCVMATPGHPSSVNHAPMCPATMDAQKKTGGPVGSRPPSRPQELDQQSSLQVTSRHIVNAWKFVSVSHPVAPEVVRHL